MRGLRSSWQLVEFCNSIVLGLYKGRYVIFCRVVSVGKLSNAACEETVLDYSHSIS